MQKMELLPKVIRWPGHIQRLHHVGCRNIQSESNQLLLIINVKQSMETVSLEDYSSGIYFVITSDRDKITSKNKVIKF